MAAVTFALSVEDDFAFKPWSVPPPNVISADDIEIPELNLPCHERDQGCTARKTRRCADPPAASGAKAIKPSSPKKPQMMYRKDDQACQDKRAAKTESSAE